MYLVTKDSHSFPYLRPRELFIAVLFIEFVKINFNKIFDIAFKINFIFNLVTVVLFITL